MKIELQDAIRERIRFEDGREGPPEGFPAFPEIPGGRYTRQDFFDLEKEHVFAKTWLCIGREEDIPERGSFRVFRKLGPPILIVRGKDEIVRAFYNTCRHRGAKIVAADCGRASLLRCQYHSWAYSLEGRLMTVPDERDFIDLDKSKRGLFPVRCETWAGWIFINLDDEAPPLMDFLKPIADELSGLGMENLRIIHRHHAVINCNWKAAMDAFQEIYHVRSIHGDSLGKALNHRAAAFGLLSEGHSRLVAPYNEDARATLGMTGADVPDIPTYPQIGRDASIAYALFPNVAAPLRSTCVHFQMFWPTAVDQCEMEVIGIGPDWGEGDPPDYWEGANARFRKILDEDMDNLASIQASLNTKAFTGIMANYQERRIYWLHEAIDRKIGHNRVPPELAVKQVLPPYMEQP